MIGAKGGVGATTVAVNLSTMLNKLRPASTLLMVSLITLKRGERSIPDDVFALFPVLGGMLRRRGGDLSGGQQQQLAIGRALAFAPKPEDHQSKKIQPRTADPARNRKAPASSPCSSRTLFQQRSSSGSESPR